VTINLSASEKKYLLWLDCGMQGEPPKLPRRLLTRGLVEMIDGEPGLSWPGVELAEAIRPGDECAGNAA
jgi:hypothetical protein